MQTGNSETEIKLPIENLELAIRSTQQLGAHIVEARHLEDNLLLDQPDAFLAKERKLLRIRIVRAPEPPQTELKTILTFKGPAETTEGVKRREEIECEMKGATNLQEILTRLGYQVTFRYQKFRTIYRPPNIELDICIDETPIGNFYELEGEILRIHDFATRLGYNRDDYITQSYASLYFRWVQKTGSQQPFMLFPTM